MPAGRPPKYETPEEMERIVDLYFLACKSRNVEKPEIVLAGLSDEDLQVVEWIDDVRPTVTGLAYTLGLSRQSLCNYEAKDEFLDTIKRAKQRIERALEQNLYGQAVTGTIFNLKNNFGWKDKTEQDIKADLTVSDLTDDQLEARIRELSKDES